MTGAPGLVRGKLGRCALAARLGNPKLAGASSLPKVKCRQQCAQRSARARRLALRSSDLQADYDYLVAPGVEVLSPPATVYAGANHGSRFFCFKDPDGTFLELVEQF